MGVAAEDAVMSTMLAELDRERSAHIESAQQATVQIRSRHRGIGSGFVLHSNGLIVTCAHVVRGHSPEVVLANGERLPGKLLAHDESLDLAAISVNADDLPVLTLGDSRALRPGSLVVALGHPWGVVGAATAGMVIGVGRPVEALPYAGNVIQVGLRMRPGHSGGPMLNDQGQVVGINTMIAGPYVGLAVPSLAVRRFLRHRLGSRPEKQDTSESQAVIV